MVADKVLKLSATARWVVARGEADYIAFNDADDLVSDRIGAFVEANPGANGWYTASQRFYTYGGRLMRLQRIGGGAAGPCVIVRRDLLTIRQLRHLAAHGSIWCAAAAKIATSIAWHVIGAKSASSRRSVSATIEPSRLRRGIRWRPCHLPRTSSSTTRIRCRRPAACTAIN